MENASNFNEQLKAACEPFEIEGVYYKIKSMPKGKELLKMQRITGIVMFHSVLQEMGLDEEEAKDTSVLLQFITDRIEENYYDFWQFFQFSMDGNEYRDLCVNNIVQYEPLESSTTAMAALGVRLLTICSVFMSR